MTEDLFAHAGAEARKAAMPLAARMRPRTLDDFSGHADLVGPGAPLRMALDRDEMWSVVLWGSPGTGKTSLARIAAAMTERRFVELSAVSATVRDVRGVIAQAASERDMYRKRTLVFLDEIHRFNKAQQDVLLPAVEDGVIALWGATTENPYFELNAPLLSRMRVLRLQPLEPATCGRLLSARWTRRTGSAPKRRGSRRAPSKAPWRPRAGMRGWPSIGSSPPLPTRASAGSTRWTRTWRGRRR